MKKSFTPWASSTVFTWPISLILALTLSACSLRVVEMAPKEGAPGTIFSLSMKYLVGWPRVAIGGHMLNSYQLELSSADPERQEVPGEELVWIEDKVLHFRVPDLPPGEYLVTIYDDKGPPGEHIYASLETAAYVIFPPVWPFVFRSNETQTTLRVLPGRTRGRDLIPLKQ